MKYTKVKEIRNVISNRKRKNFGFYKVFYYLLPSQNNILWKLLENIAVINFKNMRTFK